MVGLVKQQNSSHASKAQSEVPADLRKKTLKAFLLHFFANVILAADAEAALEPYGLTRLHNRVLVLTAMNPGATVSDLLRAMRVSHQNLNPTMRQLVKDGLLIAKIGEEDRRQKRLYPTAKGRKLVQTVLRRQFARLEAALADCGPDATNAFLAVHEKLVDKDDLRWAERLAEDPSGLADV
ncbi:MarR family transcriptional regulator [Bradyrhizobium sp. Leo121]|uniref:MarR family winged helix-turn-helix transcriptional regulator n=1 Tax=Bradyrhizobium sp. Leo121 TaxID=1571195 RepID=UPI00102A27B3|nr:MarR family transcriptional regulator [Bradyrhizobium sp. Leo121]RZN35788.1 MarR family transcriptional regulator [Bradyrhizobium sp. Leo121]